MIEACVLSAVVATLATSLAFWLWGRRHTVDSLLDRRVVAEQQALTLELRDFVGREVFGARGEIDRSRKLIREAVLQLDGSFRSMEEQSRCQRTAITTLVEADGAGSPGVREFADTAGALMGDLARGLAEGSRESVRTVHIIEEMAQHLDEMFVLLGDLQEIAGQAARMSSQAASPGISDPRSALMAFAFDMRQLTAQSGSLSERIAVLIGSAKVIINRVRTRVEDTADREMNASVESEARAESLIEQVASINRTLASGMSQVSECSNQIGADVANAIRSLQFEDIANQALNSASAHLNRLRALNQDAAQLQQILAVPDPSATVRRHTLAEFERHLRAKRDEWKKPAHKPVSQVTMSAGSVELF